jgi:hypothetical protein
VSARDDSPARARRRRAHLRVPVADSAIFTGTMRTRGENGARLGLMLAAAIAIVLGASACGGDDFENDPRPPAPVEITASIKDREVDVSPAEVGAGLVTFTIANLSSDPIEFTLSGPTDAASNEIPPGGIGNLRTTLAEGSYEVTAGEDARPRADQLEVGPERPSSQNEVLLP